MLYFTSLNYFVKRYEEGKREFAFRAENQEEYAVWKSALRGRLWEITGMNRCMRTEPDLTLHEEETDEGYIRRYYTIQTEPGVRMPFWMYSPNCAEKADGKVMLIPHGHGGGKNTVRLGQWEFVKEMLERGFIVLCPDARGSGDRREAWLQGEEPEKRRMNTHRELTQAALGFGQCILGLEIWDLMRLVDAVEELPGAKAEEIWCAGMSGGGQQTLWLSALDDRIRGAFISGYFYGMLESLVKLPMNCACNFVPHMWETADMGDLGALIAPRPFFIETGEKDSLNGAPGLDNVYPQVNITAAAYRLFHAEDKLKHSVHPGGHQWIGAGMAEFLDQMRAAYSITAP